MVFCEPWVQMAAEMDHSFAVVSFPDNPAGFGGEWTADAAGLRKLVPVSLTEPFELLEWENHLTLCQLMSEEIMN